MARRTTASLVRSVSSIPSTKNLEGFIDTASALVDQIAACSSPPNDQTLELIERWLTAHFYSVMSPVETSRSVNGASKSVANPAAGDGLKATPYGRQALLLDSTGCLLNLGTRRAGLSWVGNAGDARRYPADEIVE